MLKLVCILLVSAVLANPIDERSIGKDLKAALENVAVDQVTNVANTAISSVLNKAVEGITSGITKLLGKIHIGKRYVIDERSIGKDLKAALENVAIDQVTNVANTALSSVLNKAVEGITSGITKLLGKIHIGKRNVIDGTNVTGPKSNGIIKQILALIDKVGKRNVDAVGEIGTEVVNNQDVLNLFSEFAEHFGDALRKVLEELPQIIFQEVLPLLTEVSGKQ